MKQQLHLPHKEGQMELYLEMLIGPTLEIRQEQHLPYIDGQMQFYQEMLLPQDNI